MKKIMCLLFVIIFSLVGCSNSYKYDFGKLYGNIERAYIVEVKRANYYGSITIDYLQEIYDIGSIADDINKIEYVSSISLSPKNNEGINIMVVCSNIDFDYAIIGVNGVEEFKNDMQTSLYNARCDSTTYCDIINKYYKSR